MKFSYDIGSFTDTLQVSVMLLYLYTVSCIFLIIILGWLGRPPFSSIYFR